MSKKTFSPSNSQILPLIKREVSSRSVSRRSPFTKTIQKPSKSPYRSMLAAKSSAVLIDNTIQADNDKYKPRTDFIDLYRGFESRYRAKQASSLSPEISYIRALKLKKRKPETMKLFNTSDQRELNLQEFGMGNCYAKIFASGIKEASGVETLNLRNNRLGDIGACHILESIAVNKLTLLDLSYNSLGSKGFQSIANLLSKENCGLVTLHLEGVHLQSNHLLSITQALFNNSTLITLNLAKNNFDERAGHHINHLLENNIYIEKLDLHWNGIRGEGLNALMTGLSHNSCLLELDLSWNEIGQNTLTSSATKISECITINKTLRHLDLSNNRISNHECGIIAQGLRQNHTICGLHMEGNYCKVNCMGYLIQELTCIQEDYAHYATRFIHSGQSIQPRIPRNCWVCEKWVDFHIQWDPSTIVWNRRLRQIAMSRLAQQAEPVYIHLEIDEYLPYLLEPTQSGRYETVRAIPPVKTRFFFSYRGYAQISSTYRVEAPDEKIDKTIHFYGGFSRDISAVVTNYIEPTDHNLTALPRPEIKQYIPPPGDTDVDIPEWKIENSIFKGFNSGSEELLNKCFEFDWSVSKIPAIIRTHGDLEVSKSYLRSIYKGIRDCYKYLTSFGILRNSSVFVIGNQSLSEMCQNWNLFDKYFRTADLDVNIIACNYNTSSSKFDPGSGVIRHEFMELLVRIAIDKYIKPGICKCESDAIKKLVEGFPIEYMNKYDVSKWKWERLFNEECDMVFTSKLQMFQTLYNKYTAKNLKPGEKPYMGTDDFLSLCTETDQLTDAFTARHATTCFHLATVHQINEFTSNRHVRMTLNEFIEAFAMLVECQDHPDPDNALFIPDPNSTLLDEKLEAAIIGLAPYVRPVRRGR